MVHVYRLVNCFLINSSLRCTREDSYVIRVGLLGGSFRGKNAVLESLRVLFQPQKVFSGSFSDTYYSIEQEEKYDRR